MGPTADLGPGASGDAVRALQWELVRAGASLPAQELANASYGSGTTQAVRNLQAAYKLPVTGTMDPGTTAAINAAVTVQTYLVSGTVFSPDRAGVGGLAVQVVDKNVGGDVPLATAVTDDAGNYTASFDDTSLRQRKKLTYDLQAKVPLGSILAASLVRYNASTKEQLNVQLPANAAALPTEIESLATALTSNGAGTLAALRESDGRTDITYLANKTGWDARAVAMAATADSLYQAKNAIRPELYYALLRAGLPADITALSRTDSGSVMRIWQQAIQQGVIPTALADELNTALVAYQDIRAALAPQWRAFDGSSSLSDLLQVSIPDAATQSSFAAFYASYDGASGDFWAAVAKSFPTLAVRLQLDAQLSHLTLNNAPLIQNLHTVEDKEGTLGTALDLVSRGYYVPHKWTPLLGSTITLQALSAGQAGNAFTLSCSASSSTAGAEATETYAAGGSAFTGGASPSAASQTATVAGTATANDVLTTTVNGVPVPYTVTAGLTPTEIASGIASKINITTTSDAVTGLALNVAINASSAGGVVTLTATKAGAAGNAYTLLCEASPATTGGKASETYTASAPTFVGGTDTLEAAAQTATVGGTVTAGDVLTTTINGVAVKYEVAGSDTPASIAVNIATAIVGTTTVDTISGLALNAEVTAQAGLVPRFVPGTTAAEKATNYSNALAAQVRLSYPTAVVVDMVRNSVAANPDPTRPSLPLTTDTAAATAVCDFLTANPGFQLGAQPLERYAVVNNLKVPPGVMPLVKRLERVYQITPSHNAMAPLLAANVDSAFAVSRFSQSQFLKQFAASLGVDVANAVYSRALQVSNATLNIAHSYLAAKNLPVLGSNAGSPILNPAPQGGDPTVVAAATLEQLFGSLDYCQCEDCRSVLSPAAYLVDLLFYMDQPSDPTQPPPPQMPSSVLFSRRPDIEQLPLTCDNTNTVVPYIDLVNEILEALVSQLAGPTPVAALSPSFSGFDNTNDPATAAEVLATPENVTVADYVPLRTQYAPAPLPYYRDLELMRRYFAKFGAPLYSVMEALRPSENLNAPGAPPTTTYGWIDILMERAGISRDEFTMFTAVSLGAPSAPTFELYGFDPRGVNAQDLTRQIGISYQDLVNILEAKFINANVWLAPLLAELGASYAVLAQVAAGNLPANWPPSLTASQLADFAPDPTTWVQTNYNAIKGLIVLTNPTNVDDLCSFDQLQVNYADPSQLNQPLQWVDYNRLILFIRLWKRLQNLLGPNWTVEQTDKIVMGLFPSIDLPSSSNTAQSLCAGFAKLIPRLGVMMQVIEKLNLQVPADIPGLLTLWSDIDTNGNDSLYRAMFSNRALLVPDPAFELQQNGTLPATLNGAPIFVSDHVESLRAAFSLTAAEFWLIFDALGFGTDPPSGVAQPTPLTLANISQIYRYAWLARKTGRSVAEFVALMKFSGLNPFGAPDPPNPDIICFLDLLVDLGASSLRPVQALYLLWNQDFSGKSAPPIAQLVGFAQSLLAAYSSIESQFALVADPNGNIASGLMTLVYGSGATDFFFGLLNNALSVSVPYPPESTPNAAPPSQAVVAASLGRLSYDTFAKTLTFSGAFDAGTLAAIGAAIAGTNGSLQAAVNELYTASQAMYQPFFATYPELFPLYLSYINSTDTPQNKRTALLANILPTLIAKRKVEQALAAATGLSGADPSFAPALLNNVSVLHAAANTAVPGVSDLTAIEASGLTAQFFTAAEPAPVPAYAQQFGAVGGTPKAGDVLTTTINGIVISYTVVANDTPISIAAAIAALINGAIQVDPISGLALNAAVTASTNGANIISLQARTPGLGGNAFTLACSVTPVSQATEVYSPGGNIFAGGAAGVSAQQIATVTGTVTANDVVTTTINGVSVPYVVAASDTLIEIAHNVAQAVNAATQIDPISGLALNKAVSATNVGNVGNQVTFTAVTTGVAGNQFTLSCSVAAAATTYIAGAAMYLAYGKLGGPFSLSTAINGVVVVKGAFGTGDTVSGINASTLFDPLSGFMIKDLVSATVVGDAIVFTLKQPGCTLAIACANLEVHPSSEAYAAVVNAFTGGAYQPLDDVAALTYTSTVANATQNATVAGNATAGDVLVTTINGVPVEYIVVSGDTTASMAAGIAAAINGTSTTDPVTGLALNLVVSAQSVQTSPGLFTITAASPGAAGNAFTLACAVRPSTPGAKATETYTASGATFAGGQPFDAVGPLWYAPAVKWPASQTAAVTGTATPGDVITTTINGVAVPCTVAANDTPATIAAAIVNNVNAATQLDSTTGLALNKEVVASSSPGSPGIVTFTATTAGAAGNAFTLACSISTGPAETYTPAAATLSGGAPAMAATQTATVGLTGAATSGDVVTTTINGVPVPCTVQSGDTPTLIAARIVTTVNAATQIDPAGGVALNKEVIASANAGVVTFTAVAPGAAGNAFTLACEVAPATAGAAVNETYVPAGATFAGGVAAVAAGQTATVAGVPRQGDVVTTTINGVAVPYTVVAGDTPTTIAAGIVNNLNAATELDPTSGLALNKEVTASSSAANPGVVTFVAAAAGVSGNSFTLACAVDAVATEGYVPADSTFSGGADGASVAFQTASITIAETATPGNVVVTTINGVDVKCPVQTGDTPMSIAARVVSTVNAATQVDSISSLPLNQAVLASSDAYVPGIIVFSAITPGTAANAFTLACSVTPAATGTNAAASYTAGGATFAGGAAAVINQVPAGTVGAIWSGYLAPPQDGYYNISIAADPGATVTLIIGGALVAGAPVGGVWQNASAVYLSAATPSSIVLHVDGFQQVLNVSWQSAGLGLQLIPESALYSATLLSRLRTSYVRFLKAASLGVGLSLSAGEVAFLSSIVPPAQSTASQWLNLLSVTGDPDASTSVTLRNVLSALLDFAAIKNALSPGKDGLLTALQGLSLPFAGGRSALETLANWDHASFTTMLARFNYVLNNLSSMPALRRVYDAFSILSTFGISAQALLTATTNDPDAVTPSVVGPFQSALRARYGQADWLNVIQPINDELRELSRDALVAYILQHLALYKATSQYNTVDSLYEYLLVDTQMEPCQQTSRIRLALSSVQLFIERCLMNLEPQVDASYIDQQQWEWMKQYRVWQANREVFLWPENWLEPELRDDQSSMFTSTMSQLLQSDITDDSAASALQDYLSQLELIAKLEPSGLYYDETTTPPTTYAVARSSGVPRKYHYRQCVGASWTPWEETKLDIEDNPVLPVVWNGRLLLFWLRIIPQTKQRR